MFCLVKIEFKHLDTGKIAGLSSFTTFSLEPYLTRNPIEEMIFVVFGCYYVAHLAIEICYRMIALHPKLGEGASCTCV
jgi:hypothetical protein